MNILEKNLSKIKDQFPGVYDWILGAGEDPNIEVVLGPKGVQNLRFRMPQGGMIELYGEDPRAEEMARCQGIRFSPNHVAFIIGLGLGYILEAIREIVPPGQKCVILEQSPVLLREALSVVDVTDLLEKKALIFSLPDRDKVRQIIYVFITFLKNTDISLITAPPRLVAAKREYGELNDWVVKSCNTNIGNVQTAIHHSRIWIKNEIQNLPKYILSPGVRKLFARFAGVPAIVIAAGPSLEKNVHLLKQAKGKALLVATMPVVRVLLAHDIQPDIMISIDFLEGNRVHFEGLWDLEGTPLLFPVRLASNIVRDFQGDMVAIQDESRWLAEYWEEKGALESSNSVAGRALKAAVALGCDPIILVGQDLSFSDKTHIEGSARSRTLDVLTETEELFWADGRNDEKVLTSGRFLAFLHDIEFTISRTSRRFINSTYRGVRIKGTVEMPLEVSLEKYCRERVEIGLGLRPEGPAVAVDFDGLIQKARNDLERIRAMLSICRQGEKSNTEIEARSANGLGNDPMATRLVLKTDQLGEELNQLASEFDLFPDLFCKEMGEINRYEKLIRPDQSKEENLKIYVERNRIIFSSMAKALEEIVSPVSTLSALLSKMRKAYSQGSPPDKEGEGHFGMGKIWAELHFHRKALAEYAMALESGEDSYLLYYEMGRSALAVGKVSEARKYFYEAQKKGANSTLIQEALAEANQCLKDWMEKAKIYWNQGNWVNALLYARKVLREEPDCEEVQRIEEEAKRFREGKSGRMITLRENDRINQSNRKGYRESVDKGTAFFNQRDFPQAVAACEEALKGNADPSEAEALLACCYSEMGNMKRAEELLNGLISRFPENGLFHINLGRAYSRNGFREQAARQYVEAFKKQEQFFPFLAEAGNIYMSVKNYPKAIECFERLTLMYPLNHELWGKIGSCYFAQGRMAQAKEMYGKALKLSPDYPPARVGLEKVKELENRAAAKGCQNPKEKLMDI